MLCLAAARGALAAAELAGLSEPFVALYDARRYLEHDSVVFGNFTAGMQVNVTRPDNPVMLAAALEEAARKDCR